jgi:hypothetical protein
MLTALSCSPPVFQGGLWPGLQHCHDSSDAGDGGDGPAR